ncbi:MAG: Gx transporter family protein [Lachnospiraceae bacterium]|nr:Gx transporter family protein [Lachnospiraceae bacterium]
MRNNKTGKVATYGLLIALAMILSYVEAQIPAFFAVPGMKLGLTNVVVLFALYRIGYKSAFFINLLRILLVAMLFGNGMSLAYSLAGGMLSTLVMMLLKRSGSFRMVTVSIVGGITHNIGQILVAILILQTTALAWYLLILWFSGLASGLVIGLIGAEILKRMKSIPSDGSM